MKLPHPAALQTQAEALFSPLLSALEQREDLALASLAPSRTALFVVDMVNGFAVEGAMASPRVGLMAGPIAALVRRCREAGIQVVAFADTHAPDSIELESYPPHGLAGTQEARLCREIEEAGPDTVIEKNSTNGFLEPVFAAWLRDNPQIDTYIVTGDCTDICVLQFVLAATAWHNARNRPLRVCLPLPLVETFDAPAHPADLMNLTALSLMRSAGAELCGDIR